MESKTILLTGATDGIGLETAKMLTPLGHSLLIHGRNPEKLIKVKNMLSEMSGAGKIDTFCADLSQLSRVNTLAEEVSSKYKKLDVLINNAGVFVVQNPRTIDGLDIRFAVNTVAPYLLTKSLQPVLGADSRVVNLSSAAQAPVSRNALAGKEEILNAGSAYAQSKLALTMWSKAMSEQLGRRGPAIIAVNPGSMLASKMVKEAYGVSGGDLHIGADILFRAALSDEFNDASGRYFDNDRGIFAMPHPDALDAVKNQVIVNTIDDVIADILK